MTWEPSDIIAVVAVSIALASLVQTLLDRRAVRHAKTIQALQEEKEAVPPAGGGSVLERCSRCRVVDRFKEFTGITDLKTADKRLAELKSALGLPERPS
jgi:hypothetical protein